jgi:hypothetical protein
MESQSGRDLGISVAKEPLDQKDLKVRLDQLALRVKLDRPDLKVFRELRESLAKMEQLVRKVLLVLSEKLERLARKVLSDLKALSEKQAPKVLKAQLVQTTQGRLSQSQPLLHLRRPSAMSGSTRARESHSSW